MMDPRFLGESDDRRDPEGRLGATRGGKGAAFNPAARDEVVNIMKGGSAGCQISRFQPRLTVEATPCPEIKGLSRSRYPRGKALSGKGLI